MTMAPATIRTPMTRADALRGLAGELAAEARPGFTFMEVCGTHTMAIARFGLRDLLPDGLRLVSGPGCPVCVLPMGRVDDAVRGEPLKRLFLGMREAVKVQDRPALRNGTKQPD